MDISRARQGAHLLYENRKTWSAKSAQEKGRTASVGCGDGLGLLLDMRKSGHKDRN